MNTFTPLTPEAQIALLVKENARLKNTIDLLLAKHAHAKTGWHHDMWEQQQIEKALMDIVRHAPAAARKQGIYDLLLPLHNREGKYAEGSDE